MSLRARALLLACAVEGGLLILALPLGAWLDAPPFESALPPPHAIAYGLAATLPLLALLPYLLRSAAAWAVRLRALVERSFMPLFAESGPLDLALIAVLAGLGEEALFRGVLQRAATDWLGEAGALVLVSALFGAAHAVTLGYALLATAMGAYLGWLFLWAGDVWLPAVTHAAYDFVALLVLRRRLSPHDS